MTALAKAEVLDVGKRSLNELAKEANREHKACYEAVTSAFEHGLAAGRVLLEAQELLGSEKWRAWVEKNFAATLGTAHKYVRLARHEELLREWNVESLSDGVRRLQAAGLDQPGHNNRPDEERIAKAKELLATGASQQEVAALIGVSLTTIRRWEDPESWQEVKARQRERLERYRARMASAVDAAERRKLKSIARKHGAAMSEAYAMAERMQDVLAKAQKQADDREAKRALSEAGVHYRHMRDEIVKALGVSS